MNIAADTDLKIVDIDGGHAFTSEEQDAPGFKTYITNESLDGLPQDPENEPIQFCVFAPKSTEPEPISTVVHGRAGLVKWYLENVGFDPDTESGEQLPIGQLIENVAAHMMLSAAASI